MTSEEAQERVISFMKATQSGTKSTGITWQSSCLSIPTLECSDTCIVVAAAIHAHEHVESCDAYSIHSSTIWTVLSQDLIDEFEGKNKNLRSF